MSASIAGTYSRVRGSLVVDDLSVDDLAVVHRPGAGLWAAIVRAGGRRAGGVHVTGRRLVQLLAERLARCHELVRGFLDRVGVVALERLLQIAQRTLDRGLLVGGDLVALLAQDLLGLVHEVV